MLDPATSPREELRLEQRLIALGPESDRFLPEAFFPIGLYDVPEEALPEIAAAGFNTVVDGGKDASYLARAQAVGLRVIPYIDTGAHGGGCRERGRPADAVRVVPVR